MFVCVCACVWMCVCVCVYKLHCIQFQDHSHNMVIDTVIIEYDKLGRKVGPCMHYFIFGKCGPVRTVVRIEL